MPSWFKTEDNPHYAPFTYEHVLMLKKRGIKTGVIYPYFNGGFLDRLKGHGHKTKISFSVDNDIPIYVIKSYSVIPRFRQIIYYKLFLKTEKVFKRYVSEYGKPDIIHAHSALMGGYMAYLLSKRYKIPYVITKHSTPFLFNKDKQNSYDISALKKVCNNADKICFVSHFAQEEYTKLYSLNEKNHEVINNPVNDLFFEESINKQKNKNDFVFIAIGGLREVKNFELLIDAFSIVEKTINSVKLNIYGDGPLREKLQKKINNVNLRAKIKLCGNVNREQIKNALSMSHVLVSTSKLETFGINLIEALACGIPVVATDSGGPYDIINQNNGILVKEHKADYLAEAMKQIIINYPNYKPDLIKQYCKNKFSEDVIFEKTKEMYENVLMNYR